MAAAAVRLERHLGGVISNHEEISERNPVFSPMKLLIIGDARLLRTLN